MSWQDQYVPDATPAASPQTPAWQAQYVPDGATSEVGNINANVANAPVIGQESVIPTLKQKPGFMQSLDSIATGVDRGVSILALGMLSKLPLGNRWQNALKSVDASNEAAQQHNKDMYTGVLPQVGQVAGEVLATAPLGGALGALGKGAVAAGDAIQGIKGLGYAGKALSTIGAGPSAIGAAMPTGLGTVAKYGASALGGEGLMAGMERQRYDPNKPGQLFNTEAAGKALDNPYAAVLPMIGTRVATWGKAAGALAAAKELDPNAMARNVLPNTTTRTLSDMLFGIPAALTDTGKQAQQTRGIGDAINGWIQKTAGNANTAGVVQNADRMTEYSANMVQKKLKQLDGIEDYMWNQGGFKTAPISNVSAVKDDVQNAINALTTNKTPGWEASVNSLKNLTRKDNLTVNDLKMMNTKLSGAAISARGLDGGVGNDLAESLETVKDSLMNHIQGSLSPKHMADFSAARQLSADKFNLYKQAPKLQQAIKDEAAAHSLIGTLISEGGVLPPKRAVLSILNPAERDSIGALKVRQALETNTNGAGQVNLDPFLKAIGPNSQTGEIFNKEAYASLQEFSKYLKNVEQSQNVGWWRQMAMGGTVGTALTGAGILAGGLPGAALGLVSYAALNFIANHSPIKTLLSATNKALPKDTGEYLNKAIGRHLTRAGFFMSEDGVFKHKDDLPAETK